MQKYTVRPGDCLASIADRFGFRQWKTIYDAPDNEAFRRKRPNPNVLYPGDEITIPDKRVRTEEGTTEKRHRFRLKASHWMFRLQVLDDENRPLDDQDYELWLDGKIFKEDRTTSEGMIECNLPDGVRSGHVIIAGLRFELDLGHLDPVTRIKGVQERLSNLGYNVGPIDGEVGRRTRAAVAAFQRDQGLDDTGDIDETTRKRLLKAHDNDSGPTQAEEEMSPVLQEDDLAVIVPAKPQGLVIPKVNGAGDIQAVANQLQDFEDADAIYLIAIVETAQGIVNLKEISHASARLCALIFGAEDLAGDIGALRTLEAWEVFYARSAVVIHATRRIA